MKFLKVSLLLVISAAFFTSCHQQEVLGDRDYEQYRFAEAAAHYEKASTIDSNTALQLKLAEAYRMYNQNEEAVEWYEKAMANGSTVAPEYKLHYAQTLDKLDRQDDARKWFSSYLEDRPGDTRAVARWYSSAYETTPEKTDTNYVLTKLAINRNNTSAFSPAYYDDGIIFSTDRNGSGINETSGWTDRAFTEMWYANINMDGRVDSMHIFANAVNSPYDEGPGVYDPNHQYLYFSGTNLSGSGPQFNANNTAQIQLYRAKRSGNSWVDIEKLPFNDPQYSYAHPAISADGHTLYFASNYPTGWGNLDLWYSTMNEKGEWSAPRNLGPEVNTEGDEAFPTINLNYDGSESLYFSSTGHVGLGGYDIFTSKFNGDMWEHPTALQAPINSPADDLGYIYKGEPNTGFFSSSRNSANGVDNIYRFDYQPASYLTVAVVNEVTGLPVTNAKVIVDNMPLLTLSDGTVTMNVDPKSNYTIKVKKPRYQSTTASIGYRSIPFGDTATVVLELDPLELDKAIVLDNIYYDFDEYTLRASAQQELDDLGETMLENPGMAIRLESHCDSRGSDTYNDKLAQQRAQAVIDYLTEEHGIDRDRMTIKAYGEDDLVNNCDEGVSCTEEQHQRNRRTEFTITTWDYSDDLSDNR